MNVNLQDNPWYLYYEQIEQEHLETFDWNTDGCSSAPDRIKLLLADIDLTDACAEHDFYYRNANKLKRLGIGVSKWKADWIFFKKIRTAVQKALGFKGFIIATTYWMGVTVGGWSAYGRYD